METRILEEIGLTKGEIKVYYALLELGSTTTGPLAKKAEISPSKVYPILSKLVEKGLAGHITKGKTKYFEAASPQKLLGFLEEKKSLINEQEKVIKKLIPQLSKKGKAETKAFLYEGISSIKNMYNEIYSTLKKGDEYIAYGITGSKSLRKAHAFFQDWQVKRGKKGIRAKIVYEYDARDIALERVKAPLTDIRIMPRHFKTPAGINIYNNKVAIVLWIENPLLIIIEGEEGAASFHEYFKLIWPIARQI